MQKISIPQNRKIQRARISGKSVLTPKVSFLNLKRKSHAPHARNLQEEIARVYGDDRRTRVGA
eukprot:478786-Rhodomonas_salina.1